MELRSAGEIVRGCDVVQLFRPTAGFMSTLAPLMATYAGRRTGHIGFSLYAFPDGRLREFLAHAGSPLPRVADRLLRRLWPRAAGGSPSRLAALLDELRPIARYDERAEVVIDNTPLEIFMQPLASSAGQLCALRIHSDDASPGNALTVWLSSGDERIAGHVAYFVDGIAQGAFGLAAEVGYSPPVAPFPTNLLYSPVTQCNLNCGHCISSETRGKVTRLPDSIKDQIRAYCAAGKVQTIGTDYSGDILWADARFGGELDFLASLNVPVHIDTNGVYLTPEACAKLLRGRINGVNISLDAARDETFRRIRRGAPPLSKVVENIRGLVAARAAAGATSQLGISLSFTMMQSNIDELKDFVRLAADLGIDVVYTRHVEAYKAELEAESLWLDKERYNRIRIEALALAKELGVILAMPLPLDDRPHRCGHKHCTIPWNSMVVLGNGDVQACCIPRTKVGNLHEQSFEDLWNGPVYRAFRMAVNSDQPPPICSACPLLRKDNNRDSYIVHPILAHCESPYDEARRRSAHLRVVE